MDDREHADQPGVAQVGVEARQLGRGQHPLVDDRARREAGEADVLAELDFGHAPDQEQPPLEGVLFVGALAGADQELADPRGRGTRKPSRHRLVHRDVAPAEHPLALRGDDLLDPRLDLARALVLAGEEADGDGDPPRLGHVRGLDPELARVVAEKSVRQPEQDPGAVAGVLVGAGGAAVLESVERRQPSLDHLVDRLRVEAGDAGDAAAVVGVLGTNEPAAAGLVSCD